MVKVGNRYDVISEYIALFLSVAVVKNISKPYLSIRRHSQTSCDDIKQKTSLSIRKRVGSGYVYSPVNRQWPFVVGALIITMFFQK